MRRTIFLPLLLALLVCTPAGADTTPAPDFTWESAGQTVHLRDLTGRVVVVNFFATWCTPCQDEMPVLVAAARRYGRQGIVFIGVDAGDDPVKAAVSFVQRYGVEYQVVVDTQGAIGTAYHVTQYPTTVVIGANGDVVNRFEDELSAAQIDRTLSRYLPQT